MEIDYRSIGIIHGRFKDLDGIPIQPAGAANIQGQIFLEFAATLQDVEGLSHLISALPFSSSPGFKLDHHSFPRPPTARDFRHPTA